MNKIAEIFSTRCQLLAMTFAIEGTSYASSSIMCKQEYMELISLQAMDVTDITLEVVDGKLVVEYEFDDRVMWEFPGLKDKIDDMGDEMDEGMASLLGIYTDTAAPAQFVDLHHLADADPDSYTLRINGSGIYMVPQDVVCGYDN